MRYKVIKHKKTNQYLHFSVMPTCIDLSMVPKLYTIDTKVENIHMLLLEHEQNSIGVDWKNFIEHEVEVTPVEVFEN